MNIGLTQMRDGRTARPRQDAVLHWIDDDSDAAGSAPEAGGPGSVEGRIGTMPLRRFAPVWGAAGRPRTLEGAAAWIVQGLRAAQAEGPYWLATEARHAALMHAIGLQLLGQDQEIAFLGLLGTAPLALVSGGGAPRSRALPGWLIDPVGGHAQRLDLYAGGAVPRAPAVAGRTPSPEGLQALWAEALEQARTEGRPRAPELDYQPLIKLQGGRAGRAPLFCVPGAGDSVMGLRDWGAALGADWPVYGLQPRGSDALLLPHTTVEATAAMALRAMESIVGAGGVHLAGHSFGGWVAFEIALRWQALGRPVLSLTLLDSEAPDAAGVLDRERSHLDICDQLAGSLELAAGRPLGVFRHQLAPLTPAQRLTLLHAAMTRHGLLPARTRPEVMEGPLQAFGAALRASYRPGGVWEGPVCLIQADDPRRSAARNEQDQQRDHEAWRLWAPRLRCWKGPGNHMSMLKPPHVQACVDRWLAAGPHPDAAAIATPPRHQTKDMGVTE